MNIQIQTNKRVEFVDITQKIQDILSDSKVQKGIVVVQSMHTTAGITINENADPDVKTDMQKALEIFDRDDYDHAEGNSDSHIKTSCMNPSQTIIVEDNTLQLGTWQGVFFAEFDGPRSRTVKVMIVPS